MTPKLVYTLNSQVKTHVFEPDQYTLFTQEWEQDEIEYKHPFTGDITRKRRGYYYKAMISFEGAEYSLVEDFRDFFDVAITDRKFYPNIDNPNEFFDVDVNDNVSIEDDHAALAYRNFELIFRSKRRYDSPLNQPVGYWGNRRDRYQDVAGMETHRTELNSADSANLGDFNTLSGDFLSHTHPAVHYTKAEFDALIAAASRKEIYKYAYRLTAWTEVPALMQNEGIVVNALHVVSNGAITNIRSYMDTAPTPSQSYDVNLAVNRGDRLETRLYKKIVLTDPYLALGVFKNGTNLYEVLLCDWEGNPFPAQVACALVQTTS